MIPDYAGRSDIVTEVLIRRMQEDQSHGKREIETGAKIGANVGQSLEAARGKGHVPPGASRRNIAHILAP